MTGPRSPELFGHPGAEEVVSVSGYVSASSNSWDFFVSHKSARIAALIEACQGHKHDAHYLAFFEVFNQGLFYEAHEVLEELWLPERKKANGSFYKSLIQLAGAFVHLQKNRLGPAAALLKLSRANLEKYPPVHCDLEVGVVLSLIETWLSRLETTDSPHNPLGGSSPPKLRLLP